MVAISTPQSSCTLLAEWDVSPQQFLSLSSGTPPLTSCRPLQSSMTASSSCVDMLAGFLIVIGRVLVRDIYG